MSLCVSVLLVTNRDTSTLQFVLFRLNLWIFHLTWNMFSYGDDSYLLSQIGTKIYRKIDDPQRVAIPISYEHHCNSLRVNVCDLFVYVNCFLIRYFILQVRPVAEDEMFRVIRSGKRKSKCLQLPNFVFCWLAYIYKFLISAPHTCPLLYDLLPLGSLRVFF